MRRMIFENINCNFTIENLFPCLASFLSSEVINSGYSEVVICLNVKTKHESFIIDFESFKIKDYTHINNLLKKNIYYSSIPPKYIVKDLVFDYWFECDL